MWQLQEFMKQSQGSPPIVAITATCYTSRDLLRAVQEVMKSIRIETDYVFVPCDAAKIYARSDAAATERASLKLPDAEATGILIAASAARRMQNPLTELTRLWTDRRNHLEDWTQHRYQKRFLGKGSNLSHVVDGIERACLRAVASCGVDFLSLQYSHSRGPLQFIPGIGSKLSAFILKRAFTSANIQIKCRDHLEQHILNGTRFNEIRRNAFPFLRFPSNPSQANDSFKPLDGTLIPSEFKEITYDLISIAIGKGGEPIDQQEMIDFFRRPREKLNDLYEDTANISSSGVQKSLFDFICNELTIGPYESLRFIKRKREFPRHQDLSLSSPFAVFRSSRAHIHQLEDNHYVVMSDEELFHAFATEAPEKIAINQVIFVTILSQTHDQKRIFCKLTSGMIAHAPISDLDFVKEGKDVSNVPHEAIITEHNTLDFTLEISFNPDKILESYNYDTFRTKEIYFDIRGEEEQRQEDDRQKRSGLVQVMKRAITFDRFFNINRADAEAQLADQEVGSYLFRPSTHGPDCLTLTIKFPFNQYAHYLIVEKEQPTLGELGKKLFIEETLFEDLEEIKWEFANPIKDSLVQIMKHPKWIEDPKEALEILQQEKRSMPQFICYRITVNTKYTNCLSILWIKEPNRLNEEPIRPFKSKLRFRHIEYRMLTQILDFLKLGGFNQKDVVGSIPLKRELTSREEEERAAEGQVRAASHSKRTHAGSVIHERSSYSSMSKY